MDVLALLLWMVWEEVGVAPITQAAREPAPLIEKVQVFSFLQGLRKQPQSDSW